MADVNPAEVSAILKKQLAGYTSANTLDEVGTVLEVGDGIARVFWAFQRTVRRISFFRQQP